MVVKGFTGALAALALVPKFVPPTDCVYHLMVLPAEVALRFTVAPGHTELGVALIAVGVGSVH